ncbi:MAG: M16 family metallopeptidase [Hydrogenovibrio sp.]
MTFKQFTVLVFACTTLFFGQAWAKVTIETWQTSKGSKVMYVHAPELPMVDVEVRFDAGSARDGEKWGLASFTAGMMATATPSKDENQISEAFNDLGVQIGADAGRDAASLQMRSLTRASILSPALALFAEVLTQPVFRTETLSREKARLMTGLKQKTVQPQAMLRDALWSQLYGDHPYAHPVEGTTQTVDALTTDDIKGFYKQYYVAANAQVTIVGAVDRTAAEQMAETLVRNLPTGKQPAPIPEPQPLQRAQFDTIQFGSTQTYYTLAQLGVKRGDPDYYALFLGNHLFGGSGFGSLLMEEVREERGLVYGVSSGFYPMRVPGPFQIQLSTKNASAMEADKVVRQTLEGFMADFSDTHLDAIKRNLVGGFPLRIDSNAKIAGYISMIGFYDLPLDYLERFPQKVSELTKEDVLKAWRKHIHPDKMLTIMVGEPKPEN